MFLSLSREDFTWSRFRKALPPFLLLWSGSALLAFTYLMVVRTQLHAIERSETEKLLTTYLSINHPANFHPGTQHLQGGTPLQGLLFIRMIRGRDHIIVVNENVEQHFFRGLVDLSPDKKGVWLGVGSGEDEKILSIVTRMYGNNILVQAAKDGSEWYGLYSKLVRQTLLVVAGSSLILLPLAFYYVRLSLSSLLFTRKKITELAQTQKSGLLPEDGNGPELDSLYKQVNRFIRQNHHLVSEMQDSLDNVAHDLRTPMTRLRSVAEYGLQAENDAELREALSDCLEESERVLAMLKIMMSVAEAESGTMQLELRESELGETLTEIITLYEYVAEEKMVEVRLETETEVSVMLDRTRISQVWANLLDNAIKYGKEGGWVKISVTRDGSYGVVAFEDNGMGISENEQGRIWDRLYRGDRSRYQKGLGLGLNYVRAVLEAHGATISVSSILHEGSRFEIRLPLNHSDA
jgi:signal transduction histidine kinase